MGESLDSIGSIYWWISVVVVGILVNIASSFIWRFAETRVTRGRIRLRRRSEKEKAERQERVDRLREGGRAIRTMEGIKAAYSAAHANSLLLRSILFAVFALGSFGASRLSSFSPTLSLMYSAVSVLCSLITAFGGLLGIHEVDKAGTRMRELLEADRLDEEPDEDGTDEAGS